MTKFQAAMELGFDQMVSTYRVFRERQTQEQRMDANRKALRATHFKREELEEMLVVAIERLTS